MVTCQCCPYGFHIYLDFVQYCEKLGKNAPSKDQHIRRNNRRHRKSKILMLGFDELSEIPNLPYSNSVESLNSSSFVQCYPHEKNEFIKDILKDMCHDYDEILDARIAKKKEDNFIDDENSYLYSEYDTNNVSKQNYATPKPVAVPPIRHSSKNRVEINRTKQMKIIDTNKKDNFILNKINECPSKESSPAQLDNKKEYFAFNKIDENVRKPVEKNVKLIYENIKQSSPTGVVHKIEESSIRTKSPIPVHKKEKINLSNFEEIFMRDLQSTTPKRSPTISKSTSPKPSPTSTASTTSQKSSSTTATSQKSSSTSATNKTEQFVKNIIEGNMKNMTEKIKRESSPIAMNLNTNEPKEKEINPIAKITQKHEIIEKEQIIETKEIITNKIDSICVNKMDNLSAGKIVELNVPQPPKSIVKNIKNMGTMTTMAMHRDIGITTVDIEKRSVQTQMENVKTNLTSTKTQTSTLKARTMGTQTMAEPGKTVVNRSTGTTADYTCTKCTQQNNQISSSISLKSLNNIDTKKMLSEKENFLKEQPKPKQMKTVSTQSTIDTCTKSMQHSSILSTKSTNTVPMEEPIKKKPEIILKLNKSCETKKIQTKDVETITTTVDPVKKIDRGTIPDPIDLRSVACGDAIRPHILISCADNYCDSCKDIVKSLARNFMNLQDSGVSTEGSIHSNSELLFSAPVLPVDEPIKLLTEELYTTVPIDDEMPTPDFEPKETTVEETHLRLLPTEEMLGALNTINDLLDRSESLNIKVNPEIIEQSQWFQISSAELARPLDVKDFLDYARKESEELVQYIVNLKDANGNTAMHYAISHGNYSVADGILDSELYNVNQMNSAGYTCAMLVALTNLSNYNDLATARRLFSLADVNIRAKNHGQTALMIAVSHGNIDMVQMLLEANADVNVQDEDGSTALMCAAEHGRIDIVKLLLAQPDCDSTIQDIDNSTALKISVEAGYRDIGILLYAHERVYGKKNGKRQ